MDTWIIGGFIVLAMWGYNILFKEIREQRIHANVALRITAAAPENPSSWESVEDLVLHTYLPVTPVPGMEIQDWGLDGAVVKRVLIAEEDLTVYCSTTCAPEEFYNEVQYLKNRGWRAVPEDMPLINPPT